MVGTSPSTDDHHLAGLHDQHRRVTGFFPGQRPHEKVQLCVRRHWLAELAVGLRFVALGIALPLLGVSILSSSVTSMVAHALTLPILIYVIFLWLFTFVDFLKNELSVMIITNERLIDITQTSLFNHQISEANLDRIEDVLGFTSGMMGTLLEVGRLEIQTAGSDPFIVDMVKSPHLSARKVLNVQRHCLQQRRRSDSRRRSAGTPATAARTMHKRVGDTLSDDEIHALRHHDTPHHDQ